MEILSFEDDYTAMHISWDEMELFLAVAEEHSLSGAARRLGVSQPTASRRLVAFEKKLGAKLFARDVEGARLTPAAQSLLPIAESMGRAAQDFSGRISEEAPEPSGVVRVLFPAELSSFAVSALLAKLKKNKSSLRVEARTSLLSELSLHARGRARREDSAAVEALVSGQMDLALVPAAPRHESLHEFASVTLRFGVFASRAYTPSTKSSALKDLDWISWPPELAHRDATFALFSKENMVPVFSADRLEDQIAALRQGLGAMILPRAALLDPTFQGASSLVELSCGLSLPEVRLSLLSHKRSLRAASVTEMAEVLLGLHLFS